MRRFLPFLCLSLLAFSAALPAAAQPIRVLVREVEPFYFHKNGEVTGIDHELLQYYAKKSGRPLQLVWVNEFDDLLRRLEAGDGDLAASGITLTAARQQRFGDSGSYLPVRIVLVEPTGHTTTDLAQLRGRTLATMKGTTYEAALSKVPGVKLVYGLDEAELIAMVADGRAAATAVDTIPAFYRLPSYPGLHATLNLSEPQGYGYFVRKGSPLGADLAKHIAQMRDSGIYYRVLQKYLGPKAAEMVKAAHDDE